MKTFVYLLSGARKQVVNLCSAKTRTQYFNLGLALVQSVILAAIGGFDIASQFTLNPWIRGGVSLLWALTTLSFDYFLVSGPTTTGWLKYLRIIVGFCNIAITITALFILLNQASIDGTIALSNSDQITALDKSYLTSKEARFSEVNAKKKESAKYYSEVVEPEARNKFPGEKYEAKKAVYESAIKSINKETARLDSAEIQYFNSYQTKRKALVEVQANDFFAKVRVLPEVMVKGGWWSLILACCLFIFLGYIELQAIAQKVNMNEAQREYEQKQNDMEADELALREQIRQEKEKQVKRQRVLENRREDIAFAEQERILEQAEFESKMAKVEDEIVQAIELKGKSEILRRNGLTEIAERIYGNMSSKNQEHDATVETIEIEEAPTKEDLLKMTKPMQAVLESIQSNATSERQLAFNIFSWVVENIEYHESHGKFFYRNAPQCFNDGRGLCGEQSLLMMAFLRASDLECEFVEVIKDLDGKEVAHACVLIKYADQTSHLCDPAYKLFEVRHQLYEVWSADKLQNQFDLWNQ